MGKKGSRADGCTPDLFFCDSGAFAVTRGDGELHVQILPKEPPRYLTKCSKCSTSAWAVARPAFRFLSLYLHEWSPRRRHTDMLASAMRRSEWRWPALVPRGRRVFLIPLSRPSCRLAFEAESRVGCVPRGAGSYFTRAAQATHVVCWVPAVSHRCSR